MKKKAIIEDIDGPLYPHKQQYLAFFRHRYDGALNPEFIQAFEKSADYYYISDFMRHVGMDDESVMTLLKMHGITKASLDESAKEYIRVSMREFGDSEEFMQGRIEQMHLLNRFLAKRGIKIIGATSRAINTNPNDLYNDGVRKTRDWADNNEIGLVTTYFYLTKDKYHVLDDIKRDFFIQPSEVLAVIEDVADSLPGFMDVGIPCIMVDVGSQQQREKATMLQSKYHGMLILANDHTEVRNIVMKMYLENFYK